MLTQIRQKKELARLSRIVDEIHAFEKKMRSLSLSDIPRRTEELRKRALEQYRENEALLGELHQKVEQATGAEEKGRIKREVRRLGNQILQEILPESFALVKETCRKMLGKRWEVSDIETEWEARLLYKDICDSLGGSGTKLLNIIQEAGDIKWNGMDISKLEITFPGKLVSNYRKLPQNHQRD